MDIFYNLYRPKSKCCYANIGVVKVDVKEYKVDGEPDVYFNMCEKCSPAAICTTNLKTFNTYHKPCTLVNNRWMRLRWLFIIFYWVYRFGLPVELYIRRSLKKHDENRYAKIHRHCLNPFAKYIPYNPNKWHNKTSYLRPLITALARLLSEPKHNGTINYNGSRRFRFR